MGVSVRVHAQEAACLEIILVCVYLFKNSGPGSF